MKGVWRRTIQVGTLMITMGCFGTAPPAHGQAAAPGKKPPMAEDVLKDVRVLKGIPVDQFMDTMGFFAASLSLNCTECHGDRAAGNWAAYADQTPMKTTARKMILMVRSINQTQFGGTAVITCYSCHRGALLPKPEPSLAEQYKENPDPIDPNEAVIGTPRPDDPTADQVFSKYTAAIGGAPAIANLKSYVAKGMYNGFDTEGSPVPVEIYAKAPTSRTTIVHTALGDSVRTFDGSVGWLSALDKPMPVMPITGGDLYGAKLDAMILFPSDLKKTAAQWRVGSTELGDDHVQLLQGTTPGQLPIKLYFDQKSGLLLREVRQTRTIVGLVPTQVDFGDYRDVGGVKLPFKLTVTWTDGQANIQLDSVDANVAIEAAKFSKPAPFVAPKNQKESQ
jgi:hypothetical protein